MNHKQSESLQALALERVQLTIEICDLLWRQHDLDKRIGALINEHTSSPELRDELVRQSFYRARRKMNDEISESESLLNKHSQSDACTMNEGFATVVEQAQPY